MQNLIKNNIPFLLIIFLKWGSLYAQKLHNVEVKEKSLVYFCEKIYPKEESLSNSRIFFSGETKGGYSDIHRVAHCLGDINIFKNDNSNKEILDSIEAVYKLKIPPKKQSVNFVNCLKKSSIFHLRRNNDLILNILEPVEYKEQEFVEIQLSTNKGFYINITISFSKNKEVISYCMFSYTN